MESIFGHECVAEIPSPNSLSGKYIILFYNDTQDSRKIMKIYSEVAKHIPTVTMTVCKGQHIRISSYKDGSEVTTYNGHLSADDILQWVIATSM